MSVSLALAGDLTLYAILPVYAPSRGFALAAVGLILSANRLVRLPLNPFIGLLLSHRARRPFFLAGLALGMLSNLFYILAPDVNLFVAGRVLWGIAWSLIYIAAYCMILDLTTTENRAWGSGLLQSFYFLALAFYPLLGGFLSDALGFNTALWVCILFAGTGLLISILWLPETCPQSVQSKKKRWVEQSWLQGIMRTTRQACLELRPLLTRSNLSITVLQILVFMIGEGLFMSTITLFIARHLDFNLSIQGVVLKAASAGGAVLALRSIISSAIAPLTGKISDRWKNRWGILAAANAAGATGMVCVAAVPTPALFLVGILLIAVYSGATVALLPALVEEVNPGQPVGKLMGLLTTFGDLGMAAAPLLAYNLLGAFSLQTVYMAAALLLASGLVFVGIGSRRA